jgi:hypothetical protein
MEERKENKKEVHQRGCVLFFPDHLESLATLLSYLFFVAMNVSPSYRYPLPGQIRGVQNLVHR